jgi:uncharacterized protein with HEPN domain
MPPERDLAWLVDMRHAARAVQAFVAGRTFEQYAADLLLRSAVERQVEIVGEAARAISKAFQSAHPQIPWRAIIAQRHKLAHEYGEVDDRLIWTVATIHVPSLLAELEKIIPPSEL